MLTIAPSYYKSFSCLAGACMHSCCIGWEIDIDEDSLARYRTTGGEIGKRLRESIDESGETACFRLTEGERCPFLNRDGLCDLIIAEGEESLCQICADHPRFRNFFSDRTEIGLGLCCEEAGRLILTHEAPAALEIIEDDGLPGEPEEEESALLALRASLTGIMQDRSRPVSVRVQAVLDAAGINLPEIDFRLWADALLPLERLDEAWGERLNEMKSVSAPDAVPDTTEWEIAFEQLMVYLLYRHLPAALEDGDLTGRVAYAALIWKLLRRMCAVHKTLHGRIGMDSLIELCRMYSSEIEYSDENMAAILEALYEYSL